jgi:hypothetical protein
MDHSCGKNSTRRGILPAAVFTVGAVALLVHGGAVDGKLASFMKPQTAPLSQPVAASPQLPMLSSAPLPVSAPVQTPLGPTASALPAGVPAAAPAAADELTNTGLAGLPLGSLPIDSVPAVANPAGSAAVLPKASRPATAHGASSAPSSALPLNAPAVPEASQGLSALPAALGALQP